jgi:hypothetical protein
MIDTAIFATAFVALFLLSIAFLQNGQSDADGLTSSPQLGHGTRLLSVFGVVLSFGGCSKAADDNGLSEGEIGQPHLMQFGAWSETSELHSGQLTSAIKFSNGMKPNESRHPKKCHKKHLQGVHSVINK